MKGRLNRLVYALATLPLLIIWIFLNYMVSRTKAQQEEEEMWNEMAVI